MSWTRWQGKHIARLGALVAMAAVFSYIEAIIPIPLGVPGIKLGLANVVTVFALAALGWRMALGISLIRVLLLSMMFGNLNMALYSLAGGLFSLLVMALLLKTKRFTLAGISMAGGAAHNIAQVGVAMLLSGTPAIFYYLAILIPVGMFTGTLIGLITGRCLRALAAFIGKENA